MYHFWVLLQTELGRPKRRGVLVPAGLTYGRPNEKRDGGSSEGMFYSHQLSKVPQSPCTQADGEAILAHAIHWIDVFFVDFKLHRKEKTCIVNICTILEISG